MDSRYNYMQCRLCLHKSECLSDIFEDNGKQGFTAAEVITDLLQLKVSKSDVYPQLVCLECLDKLIDFQQFKKQCLNAKTKFEDKLHANSVKIDVQLFSKSITLATDASTETCDGFNEERTNGNIDTCEEKDTSTEENNASEFCDIVVKTELEEFGLVKELSQNVDKTTVEDAIIPCSVEIKEEELIISNADTEHAFVASYENTLATDVNPERNDGFNEERANINIDTYKVEEIYVGESNASENILVTDVNTKRYDGLIEERASGNVETHEGKNISIGENNNCVKTTMEESVISWAVEKKDLGINNSGTKHASVTLRKLMIFECSECHEKFFLRQELDTHMLGHRQEKDFPCDICEKRFHMENVLIEHKRKVHRRKIAFPCKFCGKCFTRASGCKIHENSVHKEKFTCEVCQRKFNTNEVYVFHMKIHEHGRIWACEYCDKSYFNPVYLKKHIRLHSGDIPFECHDCGKKFDHKIKLSQHIWYYHMEKRFKCDVCNRKFLQKCQLLEHMTLHTGEWPYMCEECGKKFRKSSNLKLHKRIHSGEKPYHCTLCDKKFTQRGSLTAHWKLHSK